MSAGEPDGRRPSYPPPDQILSVLGIEVAWADDGNLVGRLAADPALLGRAGRPCGVGALLPFVDLVAGVRAGALAEGDWLATTDVWLHERAPLTAGPISATTRVLQAGRRTIVSALEVEAGGRPAVTASVEFTRIRRDASGHAQAAGAIEGWTRLGGGALLDRPLERACGFRVVEPDQGVVELDRSAFVANSTGTLQGGVVALLADVAAAARVGHGARTVEIQYRFLAPTGEGPARTSTEVVRVDGPHYTVRVEVVDGADGTLVGWAICGVRA